MLKLLNSLGKPLISAILFLVFAIYFGIPKIRKYLDNNENIVIETSEEAADGKVLLPAVTVCGEEENTVHYNPQSKCFSGENISQCFLNSAFSREEMFLSGAAGPTEGEWRPLEGFQSDWTLYQYGRCHTLTKDRYRIGTHYETDIFGLALKLNVTWIFVHDPNYFYLSRKTNQFPGIELRIEKNNNNIYYHQTIKLIKHKKRNTKSNPCNDDEKYSVKVCLRKFIEKKVGCRLPWPEENGLGDCTKFTEYKEFVHFYDQISAEEFRSVSRLTGCLAPCSYTQPTQHGNLLTTAKDEERIFLARLGAFHSYRLYFAETRVKVLTEHRHPDFSSLVPCLSHLVY